MLCPLRRQRDFSIVKRTREYHLYGSRNDTERAIRSFRATGVTGLAKETTSTVVEADSSGICTTPEEIHGCRILLLKYFWSIFIPVPIPQHLTNWGYCRINWDFLFFSPWGSNLFFQTKRAELRNLYIAWPTSYLILYLIIIFLNSFGFLHEGIELFHGLTCRIKDSVMSKLATKTAVLWSKTNRLWLLLFRVFFVENNLFLTFRQHV